MAWTASLVHSADAVSGWFIPVSSSPSFSISGGRLAQAQTSTWSVGLMLGSGATTSGTVSFAKKLRYYSMPFNAATQRKSNLCF